MKTELVFYVRQMRVLNQWAFTELAPALEDGAKIDIEKTELKEAFRRSSLRLDSEGRPVFCALLFWGLQ